jgi:NADH-quinone oxidoreductase subunit A
MDAFNPNVLALALLFATAGAVVVAMYLAASLLGPKRFNRAKVQPFECGVVPEGTPREGGHRVRFYMVAISFVVFDIETIFLIPWALSYDQLGLYGLVAALVFIGMLGVGLLYELRKGVLGWN